jgi:hypothetical protein
MATTFAIDAARIERLAVQTGSQTEWVEEMLFRYDWPNQSEHEEWLASASDCELTDWLFGLFAGGR